ncbi:MupG family TIM beta-alpha barrel fold protein [Alloiococcus sp. CFN-8]|uniref:MupG family TIM beta-alpha barrel fold protein n=1 Tax=Alloiococcus sp. CFN-8 TaxID=3416081 RepID=UPI003CE9F6AE
MFTVGISLYLGTGIEKNREIIDKAKRAKVKYAFTSLHLPEERVEDYSKEVNALLELCTLADIKLIIDIGPRTIEKLKLKSIQELKETPITHIRPDYGFTSKEIAELSNTFNIVFNSSTISEEELMELKGYGCDFSRFLAADNFYPKPLTGLSIDTLVERNKRLKYMGIKTLAFVPGDLVKRGPLYEGLPTVEDHRYKDPLLSILELRSSALCDIVLIGDVDITEELWNKLEKLNSGYVELRADIRKEYSFVRDIIHHDRPDSSSYVIRSQESREYGTPGKLFKAETAMLRSKGSISIGNENYLRYSGELEIARVDLPVEARVNIIGKIDQEDIKYLQYIDKAMGFRII